MTSTLDAPTFAEATTPSASRRPIAGPVAAAVGLLIGIVPLTWHFVRDLIARDEYAFFVMIVAAGVLFVRRIRELPAGSVRRGGWRWAAPLFAASAVCLIGGMVFYLRWAAAPALVLLGAAIAVRVGGAFLLRRAVPCLILIFLAVPLPSIAANPLMIGLQGLAVGASGHVFDLFGLPNVRTGTVIEIPGHRLLVEEACSGMNSLTAIVAFSLLYAFLQRRSPGRAVALTIAAGLMALGLNVVRIVFGGLLLGRFGINLFDPGIHGWIGLAIFGLAIGLAISADHLLLWLVPIRPARIKATADITVKSSPAGPSRLAPWALAVVFAAIGIASAERLYACWPSSRLASNAVFVPPRSVGGWTLVTDAESRPRAIASLNVQNYVWSYRDGSRVAEVSFTYTFGDSTATPSTLAGVTLDPFSRVGVTETGGGATGPVAAPTIPAGYNSKNWSKNSSATGPDTSQYVQFSVTAKSGVLFSATSLSGLTLYRSTSGPSLLTAKYSTDGGTNFSPLFSAQPLADSTTTSFESQPFGADAKALSSLIVRFYGYNASSAAGTARFTGTLTISGTDTTPEPTAALLATLGVSGLLLRRSRRPASDVDA